MFGGNENDNNKKSIMEVYDKLISKHGVDIKYKKSFESILLFLTKCFDTYELLKKIYDETESLNLLEDNLEDKKTKSYICLHLSLFDDSGSNKYTQTFGRIMNELSKSSNKKDLYYAYSVQTNYYSTFDVSKAREHLKMSIKIAKDSGNETLIESSKRLIEETEHNIKVISGEEDGKADEVNNFPKMISLYIVLILAIAIIVIIAIKLKKHNKEDSL